MTIGLRDYKGSFRYVFVVKSLCVFRQKLVTPPNRAHSLYVKWL